MRCVGLTRRGHPLRRDNLCVPHPAVVAVELADFGKVARGDVDAAKCHFHARAVHQPEAAVFEAQRLAQFFVHIIRNRTVCGGLQDHTQGLGIGGIILADGAGVGCAFHAGHEIIHGAAGLQRRAEAHDFGIGVGIVFAPPRAGRHLQHMFDGHPFIAGACEAGVHRVHGRIEGRDQPVMVGNADEGGDEAFRHRPGNPSGGGPARQPIIFISAPGRLAAQTGPPCRCW